MCKQAENLIGRRFGRLSVISPGKIIQYVGTRSYYWICKCDCGREVEVAAGNLRNSNTKSCGCLRRESCKRQFKTHGKRNSAEYKSWVEIRQRCSNPNNDSYHHYGGRGIENKFDTFEYFLSTMGPRPSKDHSVDRINNDGNYEPGNVRWATTKQQNNNRRSTVILSYMGIDRSITEWAEVLEMNPGTLSQRYRYGWSTEEILYGR